MPSKNSKRKKVKFTKEKLLKLIFKIAGYLEVNKFR